MNRVGKKKELYGGDLDALIQNWLKSKNIDQTVRRKMKVKGFDLMWANPSFHRTCAKNCAGL